MPPTDLGQFLTWIGSNAAIGMVLSWIMSNWAWFIERTPGQKTAILVVVAAVMGVVSKLAVTYVPAGVVTDLQPYYAIILNAILIVGGSQLWYAKFGGKQQAEKVKAHIHTKPLAHSAA